MAEDILVSIGVILEFVSSREVCFYTKSKLDKQYIIYFIPTMLDILKSSLRHKSLFISVYGTEDSSSDLSFVLLQSYIHVCLRVAKVNTQGIFSLNFKYLNQVPNPEA